MLTSTGLLAGRLDVVTDALHHLILSGRGDSPSALRSRSDRVLRSSLLTDPNQRTTAENGTGQRISEGRIMAGHVLRNSVGGRCR